MSSRSLPSSAGADILLTGRTNLEGDVNKYRPGYAPFMLKGMYPTSKSTGIYWAVGA